MERQTDAVKFKVAVFVEKFISVVGWAGRPAGQISSETMTIRHPNFAHKFHREWFALGEECYREETQD